MSNPWPERLYDVYRTTERRDGCVFKTLKVGRVWLPWCATDEERRRAMEDNGGDTLAATTQERWESDENV